MSNLKYYFLVPNYDEFPENGPLFLGSIIANPKMPAKSLNKECCKLPATEKVIEGTPIRDWKNTLRKGDNGESSLWAKFLEILKMGFNARFTSTHEMSEEDVYEFDLMTTKFFEPSDAYLKSAMLRAGVKRHLQASSGNNEPLFMVVGLKTVKGAKITQTIRSSKGRNTNLGMDGDKVEFWFGKGGQSSSLQVETRKFTTEEPHVIGFRIREIKVTAGKSALRNDVTEGAYFEIDKELKSIEESWTVEGLEGEDCSLGVALNLDMSLVIDDQGGYCQCIY
ncbi:hypothetical protein OIDMADRAFT_177748 [Oidiodendron maius Zn]|uniref:Uncharacterized protein n=1 Tax=Oidiodendron maius (strain Zn) TaxID=913774 RepID=A0A0C3H652_OIDMZ|nr:hypothetical protein OIDMADRAFT_177748 [Oidiodendron maius Zn]